MQARSIKTLQDAITVIKSLQDWQQSFPTQSFDMKGFRLTGAAASKDPSDYVTKGELTNQYSTSIIKPQHYTQVFDLSSVANTGDLSPSFVVQKDRTGDPVDCWVTATVGPPSGDFVVQLMVNGSPLLVDPLTLPAASVAVIHSSKFVQPTPFLGQDTKVWVSVINGGGATLVSIGLVVNRRIGS